MWWIISFVGLIFLFLIWQGRKKRKSPFERLRRTLSSLIIEYDNTNKWQEKQKAKLFLLWLDILKKNQESGRNYIYKNIYKEELDSFRIPSEWVLYDMPAFIFIDYAREIIKEFQEVYKNVQGEFSLYPEKVLPFPKYEIHKAFEYSIKYYEFDSKKYMVENNITNPYLLARSVININHGVVNQKLIFYADSAMDVESFQDINFEEFKSLSDTEKLKFYEKVFYPPNHRFEFH